MDIKKRDFLTAGIGLGAGIAASTALGTVVAQAQEAPAAGGRRGGRAAGPINSGKQPSTVDMNYKPRRLNKCIELWEDGQPIYYTGAGVGPNVDPYEQGKKMCKTWADAINYEMEHGLYDLKELREFMRGLKDGGGTKSGHKFPAVFVTPPVIALDEAYARANSWVIGQILDAGVMGVHICHARDTKAVEVLAHMACRYPFQDYPTVKVNPKLQGLRGNSASYAADIWGVAGGTYQHIADLWPLNPRGEIMFGLKIEDTYADKQSATSLAVPGVAFAEWGPGDHNLWLNGYNGIEDNGPSGHPEIRDAQGNVVLDVSGLPNMVKVRQNVLDLCKKYNVKFLNAAGAEPGHNNIVQQIKDGTMVVAGGEDAAVIGREYTKRKMPV